MSRTFKAGILGRTLFGNNLKSIVLTNTNVCFYPGSDSSPNLGKDGNILNFKDGNTYRYELDEFKNGVKVDSGIMWSSVTLTLKTAVIIVLKGLSNDTAQNFSVAFSELLNERTINEENAKVHAAVEDLCALERSPTYLRKKHVDIFLNTLLTDEPFWQMHIPSKAVGSVVVSFKAVQAFFKKPEVWRDKHNSAYVEHCLEKFSDFFDSVADHGLTIEQQRACIIDDSRMRLVAGAGSGKTTTLFAKAAFLVECCGIPASRILAITYSKKSQRDLVKRFAVRESLSDISISTIHALGALLIGEEEGRKSALPPWVENESDLARLMDEWINESLNEPTVFQAIQNVLLFNNKEIVPVYEFKDIHQYYDYVKRIKPISLRGETLKSQEECFIANFLYVNGVDYSYEHKYASDTATPSRRQYMPDFYLPGYDLYLENYGISRDGGTAPDVDAAEYGAAMGWKRDLHASNKTTCLETFSYEAAEGTLLENLEQSLIRHGVAFHPLPEPEILEKLRERGRVSSFHQMIRRFITLFKERPADGKQIEQLFSDNDFEKANLAPTLRYLFERYQATLRDLNVIDFSDMILKATTFVSSGNGCKYDVVLLDEAQDLSYARASLVRELCNSGKDVRLCAVGDDWQSIYRFAGSDISIFTEFSNFFGEAVLSELTHTHRFDEQIALPTAKFIRVNKTQTQRSMNANVPTNERPRLVILEFGDASIDQTEAALSHLDLLWPISGASVLIIVRAEYDKPANLGPLKRQYPSTTLSVSTAHSAKGLEADFVILINVNAGCNGFPSIRPNDVVIERLLPKSDGFPESEDRRLFYVAMTRARNAVIACTLATAASPFLDELKAMSPPPQVLTALNTSVGEPIVPCRSCGVGHYVVIDGKHGSFASCTEFPRCRETSAVCPSCGIGIMALKDNEFFCTAALCAFVSSECPQCQRGWLVSKKGRSGAFVGCSRWRKNRAGCGYTSGNLQLQRG